MNNHSAEETILKALNRLGSNADQVAKSLAGLGITGFRKCPYDCPIANVVKSHSLWKDSIRKVSVRRNGIKIYFNSEIEPLDIVLPQAVVDFVRRFDGSLFLEWPSLEKCF